MAKAKGSGRTTPRKQAPRPTGDNADLLDLFAEAEAKATERNGVRIRIGDKTLDFWPSRVDYRDRQRMAAHTGLTPNDATMMLASGSGSIEAIAAVFAMAMFQNYEGVLPEMNGVVAWVEHELLERDRPEGFDRMEVETLDFETDALDEAAPN